MAADDTVPTPDELIGKGIDKLVELRPSALKHVNNGRGVYANVFAGWRAQAALMCRRLADHSKNGRLKFAEGGPLRFLAASEFDTPASLEPTKAVGQVVLVRDPGRTGGSIRKGARFNRPADTSQQRLWTDMQCVSVVDVGVQQGQVSVTVPIEASRTGSTGNRPLFGALANEIEIADDIVDQQAWTVQSYELAGGSDGIDDLSLRRYASAFETGQYGPNAKAALAGALRAGALHAIALDDPSLAALVLYVADESWASSDRWTKLIRQSLFDNKFIGFGCKVLVRGLSNLLVGANVTCKVRRPEYLTETTTIDAAIQKTLRSYLDDRGDWNRFKNAALRGVTARADRRLLSCLSAELVRLDGTIVSEPDESSTTHFMLADQAVRVTYQSPT